MTTNERTHDVDGKTRRLQPKRAATAGAAVSRSDSAKFVAGLEDDVCQGADCASRAPRRGDPRGPSTPSAVAISQPDAARPAENRDRSDPSALSTSGMPQPAPVQLPGGQQGGLTRIASTAGTSLAGAPAMAHRAAPASALARAGAGTEEPAGLRPGMMFQHYQLIRELGRGGMGAVYLARDTHLGRRVAMKFLACKDESRSARFLAEARVTARCEHDNIVAIYHADQAHGRSYMVLEFIEGVTLRQWMRQRWHHESAPAPERAAGALVAAPVAPEPDRDALISPALAVELMVPVVRALAHAHQLGLVHRDLKPENIMLTDEGAIKVLDFGVAKVLDPQQLSLLTGENTADAGIVPGPETGAGALLGTLPYMSPEQWGIDEIDGRSDIWAVGIMLWELCTGLHPLAPCLYARLRAVAELGEPMASLAAQRPDLGPVADIVDHCLVKRKAERMPSATALLAALEPLLPGRGAVVAPSSSSSLTPSLTSSSTPSLTSSLSPSLSAPSPSSLRSAEAEPDNPYVGLAAFQERDVGRFFGRDREIASLVNQLRNHRLVAVVGASGAGKSSFVRAGVIPALARSGQRWAWFIARPGRQPLAGLAGVLAQIASPAVDNACGNASPRPAAMDHDAPIRALRAQPGLLGTALRAYGHRRRARIVLFIDQFEELYTLSASQDHRQAFVRCLEGVADDESSPLRVVLSVRSDFLDRVAEDRAFMSEITRGLWFLPPMQDDALRAALLQPLQAVGYALEDQDQLAATILDALKQTRAPLPLLQFTAARLWELRDPAQKRISRTSYQHLGGVAGALAAHADTVLTGLSAREQRLARLVLTNLVTEERTRAIVSLDELRALVPAGLGKSVEEVVQHLAAARLLLMETDMHRGGATVEMAHESLIARWPRLGAWLREDREESAFRTRLRAAARAWDEQARNPDLLWRGQVADEARHWLARWRSRDQGAAHWGNEAASAQSRSGQARGGQARGPMSGVPVSWGPVAKVHAFRGTGARDSSDVGGRDLDYLHAVVTLAEHTRKRQRRLRVGAVAAVSAVAVVVSVLAVYAGRQAEAAAAEAMQARNASRMASAREYHSEPRDPTLVLALVRELESSARLPPRWRALARWAIQEGVTEVILDHPDAVNSAMFSPDGRFIVTASSDKAARVWPVDDSTVGLGAPVVLQGHRDEVYCAAFSPDGRRIVTASKDWTARVWPFDSSAVGGDASVVLQGHQDRVTTAVFSPDGRRIVTASWDKTARIWNADGSTDGSESPLVLHGHEDIVTSATFSPDGRRIVTASFDKTARVWNVGGSTADLGVPLILQGHDDIVTTAVFSPDGRFIVTASKDKTARVWPFDGATSSVGQPLVLRGHRDVVMTAMFSPDGRRIVTASWDKTARVWPFDGATFGVGRSVVLQGHRDEVMSAGFSPDGRRIVTASQDKTARVWPTDSATTDLDAPLVLQGHRDFITSAVFSRDGRFIATASCDKTARVWPVAGSAAGLAAPLVLQGHRDWVTSAAFSRDGQRIVTASYDNTARVWPIADSAADVGAPLVLRGHEDVVTSARFSRDGRFIVTASWDKTARVWPVNGSTVGLGTPVILQGHQDVVTSAMFSPDSRFIVTASLDNTAWVWPFDSSAVGLGAPVVLQGHQDWVTSAAFSPDGRFIVTTSRDKTVRVWPWDGSMVGSGAPLVLRGHQDSVISAMFSPNGARIVTISNDKTMRVWNTDGTGIPLIVRAPDLDARSVAFSPDGTRIVSASHSQRIAASGEVTQVAKVWSRIERFRDLDDPKLWRATTYCPPIELRMELLGVSRDRAARDLARCKHRVAQVRP